MEPGFLPVLDDTGINVVMCNLPFDTYTQHQIMDNQHGSPLPRLLRACMNRPRWKFTLTTEIRLYSYMIHQALIWRPKQEIESWPLCIKPNSRDSGISNMRTLLLNAHTLSQCIEWKKRHLSARHCSSVQMSVDSWSSNESGPTFTLRSGFTTESDNRNYWIKEITCTMSCVIWVWDY